MHFLFIYSFTWSKFCIFIIYCNAEAFCNSAPYFPSRTFDILRCLYRGHILPVRSLQNKVAPRQGLRMEADEFRQQSRPLRTNHNANELLPKLLSQTNAENAEAPPCKSGSTKISMTIIMIMRGVFGSAGDVGGLDENVIKWWPGMRPTTNYIQPTCERHQCHLLSLFNALQSYSFILVVVAVGSYIECN